MILHEKMLQQLADRIIENIGYNINIIDTEGIIVASGSKNRIGTYHAAGYIAATSEKRIDITKEEETEYKGVKAGINQPFYYKNQLVGVIGITGNTKTISDFVNIVKTMIELMVEQELLKTKMFFRQSNKTYFANLLLNIKTKDDLITLNRWGEQLGYNFNIPRVVIVVAFTNNHQERVYSDILEAIKKVDSHDKEDFSTIIDTNKLLLLKTYRKNKTTDNNYILKYADDIYNVIKQISNYEPIVAIASYYKNFSDYYKGYQEANFVIEQLKNTKKTHKVASINDCLMTYFASKVPEEFLEHFINDIYMKLSKNKELLQTVIALSKNEMNLIKTSKSLYVHRNTVVFRIKKIKEISGLDIKNDKKARLYCHFLAAYCELKLK